MIKKLSIPLVLFFVTLIAIIAYTLRSKPLPIRVTATNPTNNSSLNPFSPVIITLNQDVRQNDVKITINPTTDVNIVESGKTIQIVPKTKFTPNTQYSINIGTDPSYVIVFTTERSTENFPGWNQLVSKSLQQYEQQNATQDAALKDVRTHAPIGGNGFNISYSYADDSYTITLSSPYDQSKNSFLSWLTQKGVTNLTSLRLNYVNQ